MQNKEVIELNEKLDHILSTLSHQRYAAKEIECLWRLEDIATYLGLSKSSVKSHIVSCPSFPRAVDGGGNMGRRWKPVEVKAWAERRA